MVETRTSCPARAPQPAGDAATAPAAPRSRTRPPSEVPSLFVAGRGDDQAHHAPDASIHAGEPTIFEARQIENLSEHDRRADHTGRPITGGAGTLQILRRTWPGAARIARNPRFHRGTRLAELPGDRQRQHEGRAGASAPTEQKKTFPDSVAGPAVAVPTPGLRFQRPGDPSSDKNSSAGAADNHSLANFDTLIEEGHLWARAASTTRSRSTAS